MNRFALALFGCALCAPVSAQSGIVSDDFNDATLGAHWVHVDPLGDTSLALEGYGSEDARVVLALPAGPNHDMWEGANHAPRLLQNCNDVDFEVEVKFDSPTLDAWTSQGIVVQESFDKFLRFEFLSRPTKDYLFEASIDGESATLLHQSVITGDPRYLRVKRTGDVWLVTYSHDGIAWSAGTAVTHALIANQVGVHATSVNFGAPAHAFASRVDYFFDTTNRIAPEDGPVDTEAPTANAGESRSIHAGQVVYLDGSGSADDTTATNALTYIWTLVGRPNGSQSSLLGGDSIAPSFVADATGIYIVQLVVIDAAGFASEPSFIEISSQNLAPVAEAGAETVVALGEAVMLDGLDSFDPEGAAITYFWSFVSKPAGSAALLVGAQTATPSFTADAVGDYVVQLIVDDAFASSEPDEVFVTAVAGTNVAIQKLRQLARQLGAEHHSKFVHRWHKIWLTQQLRDVIKRVQNGHLLAAENQLKRILRRTDGFALRGNRDSFWWWWCVRPDMIADQELQLHAYETINCAISIIQSNQ